MEYHVLLQDFSYSSAVQLLWKDGTIERWWCFACLVIARSVIIVLRLTTSVIHELLLATQTFIAITDLVTKRKWATTTNTAGSGVDNDEWDQSMANFTPLQISQITCLHVDKKFLHLLAVIELAQWCTWAVSGVDQHLQIALQTLGSFFLTFLCICRLIEADSREGMAGVMSVSFSARSPRSASDRLVAFVA